MNGLSIQTNSGAASANMHTQRTSRALNKSVSRLSSGLRVQNAGDDAAALAVSEKMRAQLMHHSYMLGVDATGCTIQYIMCVWRQIMFC